MNPKKYQVFISSTYTDLIEERRKILDVLLMADCIPAGMEAFVATDDEQFSVIKKVIDLCDYYILIVGMRYGSINPSSGKSYTEMEYEYALEQGIPVLVFAIDDTVELPSDKKETTLDNIEKLNRFREKALTNRLASLWKTGDDLAGKVAISIMQAKTTVARPGWQRAVDYDEASLRREIMVLQENKKKLEFKLNEANDTINTFTQQNNLAFTDCDIKIDYHYTYNKQRKNENKTFLLPEIFSAIATEMMDVMIVESKIESTMVSQLLRPGYSEYVHGICIDDSHLVKRILNQLKALRLVDSQWSSNKSTLFWGLTPKGKKVRDDMILLKDASEI